MLVFTVYSIFNLDFVFSPKCASLTDYIPRTLELFVHSLLTKTMQVTNSKNAKTLSPSHM